MTGAIECRYYGRDFTADEMALLRALIAAKPQPNRAALSREFCRCIGWLKPDGVNGGVKMYRRGGVKMYQGLGGSLSP